MNFRNRNSEVYAHYRSGRICFISFFLFSFYLISAQISPIYSVYLIGDTGEPLISSPDPVFESLKNRLILEDKNSAVLFLGDNIYHNGLPPKEKDRIHRKEAEEKLLVQLRAIEDFKGKIYFIPGNHDWNNAKPDGIEYIREQEEFVEFFLNRGDSFIPDHGCPGPVKKKLGDKVVLIALDSQWWLHPHPDEYHRSNLCKNKNYNDILQELGEMLDEEEDKWIIIAVHHPLYSEGSHNGFYGLADHIFPLTVLSSNLFIPLPGLGSLHPFYRSVFGAKQDMIHPLYEFYTDQILRVAEGRKNVMFVSGHEHNLQYFRKDNHHFIKSGSGSKTSPLPRHSEALFSSDEKGYAKLEFYPDNDVRLKYITVSGKAQESIAYDGLVMRQSRSFPVKIEPYNLKSDSILAFADDRYKKGFFHEMVFGKLYRKDWVTKSRFKTFNISTEKGGLQPTKIGGGLSSLSIRLEDQNKKEYVLRSVQKGVEKVLPLEFRNSVVQHIFQDQIAASQPYGALMVPPIAEAVEVYHTNPEIVYLPKQEALGDYNGLYGSQLYLFEERPAGDMEDNENFGNSKKIISFSKMLRNLEHDNRHHIHQDQVLKSRLLDIFLGDWDRHDDQWRWASFEERADGESGRNETYYEPIPRDRDQVFFKYRGLVPSIAKLLAPELRKFQSFGPGIKNIKYLGFNARHFDRSFLNTMSREDFLDQAKEMQIQLSDEVLEESVRQIPSEIRNYRAEFYESSLKARRDKLIGFAEKHYLNLAKYVDIPGSDKKEFFEIVRQDSGRTRVRVFDLNKDNQPDELLYERLFLNTETKEIRLYGLGGEDVFELSGSHKNGSIVRIIGGKGDDVVRDNSSNLGSRKSLILYDDIYEENNFSLGNDSQNLSSSDYLDNVYDRKEYYYDSFIAFVLLGYNPNDGLLLNYRQALSKYGFRKVPYASQHSLSARIALGSREFRLGYLYEKTGLIDDLNFELALDLSVPDDVNNFFGLGNNQKFVVSDFNNFNYFRYKTTELELYPSFLLSSEHGISTFRFGPFYHYVNLKDNNGKFLTVDSGLPVYQFEDRHFTGLKLSYQLKRVNSSVFPTKGMDFQLAPSYIINLNRSEENFVKLHSSLTLYNYFWAPRNVVLATRIEAAINFGEFGFTQANYIGQKNGLRAYRDNRFGGRASFLISNDLRIRISSVESALIPFSWGLIASFDRGRVWLKGEDSVKWHNSAGGGFWINPFDIIPVSFYYLHSNESESSFLVKFGFAF